MPSRKRVLDGASVAPKAKRIKFIDEPATTLTAEELDFPRGGGTSFTPLEVKAIRAEAVREADGELFKV